MSSSNSNAEPKPIIVDELVDTFQLHNVGPRGQDVETVEFFDMAPYNQESRQNMAKMIQGMIDTGDFKPTFVKDLWVSGDSFSHPGGSVPEGVGVMDHIRAQCRALDLAMKGRQGSVPVTVDISTLENLYEDGIYVGPMSLEEIRNRIQGGRGHG